jgi:hypothetical protein
MWSIGGRPRAAARRARCRTPRHGVAFLHGRASRCSTRRIVGTLIHTLVSAVTPAHNPSKDRIEVVVQQLSDNGGRVKGRLLAASIWLRWELTHGMWRCCNSRQMSASHSIGWRQQDASRPGSHMCSRSSEVNRPHKQPVYGY